MCQDTAEGRPSLTSSFLYARSLRTRAHEKGKFGWKSEQTEGQEKLAKHSNDYKHRQAENPAPASQRWPHLPTCGARKWKPWSGGLSREGRVRE